MILVNKRGAGTADSQMPNHDVPVSLSPNIKDHLNPHNNNNSNNNHQRSPRSVESTPSKDPDEFFKQYRMDFNRSQYAIDSVHRIKFKKTEEDDHMIQHHFELSSFANIQFDKIAISPIQNSRNSNISESNRHAMSEINATKHLAASSNNILGSEQLNEIGFAGGYGSNLNPRYRSNLANNELELDYSSFNPGSNNHYTISQQHNFESVKNPFMRGDVPVSQQKIGPGIQSREGIVQSLEENTLFQEHQRSYGGDDYDELFDYNEPIHTPQQKEKPQYLSIKDRLRNSFKKIMFLEKIESSSITHTIQLLESQYRLINDLSSDVYYATKRKADEILLQCIQAVCCYSQTIPSINPLRNMCLIMDLVALLFYLVAFFMVSVQVTLNSGVFDDERITSETWMRAVAFIVFFMDMIKGMTVGYFSEGNYEGCTVTITHNYLKKRIYFDLIAFIPLIAEAESFGRLIPKIIGHIEGINDIERSWLFKYDLIQQTDSIIKSSSNVWERYLQSISISAGYLSSSVVFQPETLSEKGFSAIASFLSLLTIAYFVNEVSISLRKTSEDAQQLAEEKKNVNEYMDQTKVPSDLKGCVTSYLDYLHEKKAVQATLQTAGSVIKKLPQDLRMNLLCTMKSYYVPYFRQVLKKFSPLTIANTFMIIEQQSYAPGDVIFWENDYNDISIFAIVSGEVEIFHTSNYSAVDEQASNKRETCIATLKHRDCFGEIGFFTNMPHTASARCTEFTTIVKINRQKFIALLGETNQEEDFEMMCMLRDEVLFKKNFKAINSPCWSCNRYGHIAKNCKAIHFYPLKSRIINTRSSNYKQQRQKNFERRKPSERILFSTIISCQTRLSKNFVDELFDYVERYYPGQSNRSDYQQSSQSLTNTILQSSNTEILSDKIDYEQLQKDGSNLDLPQPFNTTFKPIHSNTLNESSMLRQAAAASSSKPKHKDSNDSLDVMKQRKDSAQTKNSNDSSFVKHKSTNRSQNNNNSNKRDSPIDILLKVESLSAPNEPNSNLRKSSNEGSQPTESLHRDKTLKSQKTRGTQKTNKTSKTNKSGSSLYRSMFEHAPVQHVDSRASHSSIPASPHRNSPLMTQENNGKILLGSANSKNSLKGSGGLLLGNSFEYVESEQNLSHEVVLPRIELVMANSAQKQQGSVQNPQFYADNQMDNNSNMSSMLLDQQSFYSRSESNILANANYPYVANSFRPSNIGTNFLEFDCMKNFKVYNTKSNLKNVLSHSAMKNSQQEQNNASQTTATAKRATKKKVTIIENQDIL